MSRIAGRKVTPKSNGLGESEKPVAEDAGRG